MRLQAKSDGFGRKTVRSRAENACAEPSSLSYDRPPAVGFVARDHESTKTALDTACREPTMHIERRAVAVTVVIWEIPVYIAL